MLTMHFVLTLVEHKNLVNSCIFMTFIGCGEQVKNEPQVHTNDQRNPG